MRRTEELTKDNLAARLNVCLCYSSTEELLHAVDQTIELAGQRKLPSQLAQMEEAKNNSSGATHMEVPIKITQADFDAQLYGGGNCRPDILIRTSNEVRLSNFLLY